MRKIGMLTVLAFAGLALAIAACGSSDDGAGLEEAPIESAEVVSIDTNPPSYELAVVGRLHGSSCYSPAGHEVIREDTTFKVRVLNYYTGADMCTADLGYYSLQIPLPGGFISGTQYTIELNQEAPIQFTAE